MALFQISEPGMAPAPHQRKLAVGIDLGTTNSLVASVKNSIPEVLLDESGNAILPSIVHYGSDKVLVGKEALANASVDPQNTILSTKRLMGRSAGNLLAINQQSGYKFAEQSGSVPAYITVAGNKTPLEVSAEILKVLIERAQATLGGEIEGAVITVPAYFDDAQRQATKDAARLADINVLRLLNEPTAAALAYGLDKEDDATFVVYDLGGGTFDVTILQYSRGVFEVLSTGGDSALGGDDFDHLIAEWVVNTYAVSCSDDNQFRELIMAAKKAKESLSEVEETMIALSFHSERCLLKRDVFDELVSPLINKTIDACKQALKDAEVKSTAIDNIIMVGGSTRMLSIRDAVGAFFNQPVMTDIDPDRVVALGAAIQADILVGNKPDSDLLLLDVIPLSLGIETMGGLVERIIERNTTIPIAKAQEFTTYKDGQTAMAIHVVQGERDLVEDSRSLARFELKGIPPMAAGAAQIRVTYQVDADGLLSVTAKELNSGVESSVQVKPSYGLSDDEITKMLHASFEHAGIDKDARALREQQVDADRLIVTLQQAMIDDGDELLNDDEKQSLETAISTLLDSRNGQNVNLIKENIKQLSTLSESFAAKRMDAAIKKALTGHALDDLDGGSD